MGRKLSKKYKLLATIILEIFSKNGKEMGIIASCSACSVINPSKRDITKKGYKKKFSG
jgi:hypothetical protein